MTYAECCESMLEKFRGGDPWTVAAFGTEDNLRAYLRGPVMSLYVRRGLESGEE